MKEAREYLKAGLNPVPLERGGKVPIRKDWGSPINEDIDKYDFEEVGICTGAVSGGLEGIDFDLKYADNPDELWSEWKKRIPKEILGKLTVQTTKNNGYHVLYRTKVVEGNRKLAKNEKKEVLIETRGEGGYLKCSPSQGYELVYGDLCDVKEINETERAILINTSLLFDKSLSKTKKYFGEGEFKDPFPVYNADPDTGLDILEKHDWTVIAESSTWVELTRPGKSEGVSAGYNLEGKFLYVFTTSTDFEAEQPYSNSAIYCMLEAEGNYKKGYAMLGDAGYGGKKVSTKKVEEEDEEIDDLSFISKDGEDEEKLRQAIEGTIPLGLTYGWKALDEYIVYKENTLNFILAFEGVGKTYMELHKLMALAVLYGKKFGVSCGENEVYSVKRILIEAVSGKDITEFKGHYNELRNYKDFVNAHFFVFKNDTHYSIEDILKRGEKLKEIYGINGLLIDPFSYYKRPLENSYTYSDDLLSRLNIYSKTVCSVFMTLHPNTDATRAPRDEEGYLKAPTQYDAIGGNIFANRTDHFMVYHRIRNHKVPAMRRIMELRQYKIKDESTGGSVTPINESVFLTYKTVEGFKGYFDNLGNNPMYKDLKKGNKDPVEDLPKIKPTPNIF